MVVRLGFYYFKMLLRVDRGLERYFLRSVVAHENVVQVNQSPRFVTQVSKSWVIHIQNQTRFAQ